MASFKVGDVDATQSTSITNISDVPSKVNFEADSIYDIQEKLNLDEPPYVNDDPYEFKKAAQYGYANSLAGVMYHASAVPGWADRGIDAMGRFFGGDPDKWTFNYLNGDSISEDFKVTNKQDYFKYQKLLTEQKTYNESFKDKNALARAGIWTAAWIDDKEEYLKEIAKSQTPEEKYGLDPSFKPEGLPEAIVSGFAGMPVTIAEYGAAIAGAGLAIGTGGIPAAVVGFSSLAFLGSYEQPLSKVASDTALGALEGLMFGAVAKFPDWRTRTLGLAGVGAATAKMHGGGTTEMAAAAINLAGLGIAGRGLEKLVGKNVITPKEEVKKSEAVLNIIPGWDIITKDMQTYHKTLKHLNTFKETAGEGIYQITTALPFKFRTESLSSLSKTRVPGRDTAANRYSDVIRLEPVGKDGRSTQRDIDAGKDNIRYNRIELKEVKNEKGEVEVKEVSELAAVPRELIMVDGKLPYMKFYFDTVTKKITTKVEADGFLKTMADRKTPDPKPSDTPIQRAFFIQGRSIPTFESNAKAFADIFKVKHYKERYVEMTYDQLTKFNKDRKKQGSEWKKDAYKEATRIKELEENLRIEKINEYTKDSQVVLDSLARIANLGMTSGRTPGSTPFENPYQLIESILSYKRDASGLREKKVDKDGKPLEKDILEGTGDSAVKRFTSTAMGYGIPLKLLGDPSQHSILRYITSTFRNYEFDARRKVDDIFYRTKIDYTKPENSTRYVETDAVRSLGNVLFRLTGMRGVKTFRDKDGAFTLYDNLIKVHGTKKGIEKMDKIRDVFITREILQLEKAKNNLPKNATPEQIQKEYASRLPNGKFKYQMTYPEMQKIFKLDNELQNIVIKLDRGLADARIVYNKAVEDSPRSGELPVPELPNYFPRTWSGNHKIFLKEKDTGRPVATFSGETKADVQAQAALFRKNYPEYKNKIIESDPIRKSYVEVSKDHNLREAFFETARILEHKDPKLAQAVLETYKVHRSGDSFARVKRTRKAVEGYRGTETGRKGVDEFTQVMKGYIESAVRAGEALKFKEKIDPVFESRELNTYFPEQMKFGEKYIDNAFGRNQSTLSTFTDRLIDGLSQFPIFQRFGPKKIEQSVMLANTATLYTKLLFFNPRFIYSQIVQPYQMMPQRLEFLKQEFGIKGDVAKAIVEGSALTFKPNKEFKELILFALPKGTLDAKFLAEFGIDPTTAGRPIGKGAEFMRGAFERLSGNRLSGRIERYSRLNALAMIYSYLKDAKYDKVNGKEKMFRDAIELTDNLMVEYNSVNRPLLFGKQGLGLAGSTLGLFKTFQHNYYGQMIQYIRTWAKNDYKFEASKPLLFHMTGMLMTAGLFGILAVNQIDGLIEFANKTLKKFGYKERIPTYSDMVLVADIPKEVKFGLPSALVGMDLSQTLTAPGLGITDIFSAPSLDYLFGLTSRSNEGVVGSSFNVIAKKMSGTYTDADMLKFYKAILPPIAMAEVERQFAGIPLSEVLKSPFEDIEDSKSGNKYFTKDSSGRYVVANAYKGMRGQIERDAQGFLARYFAGRSFEESLILKTIWTSTKLSRNQRDTVNTLVTMGAQFVNNNHFDELMPILDRFSELGYTQDQAMEKIFNRVESMNNTTLSRIKALQKVNKLDEKNFIFDVLKNNEIDLKFLPNN